MMIASVGNRNTKYHEILSQEQFQNLHYCFCQYDTFGFIGVVYMEQPNTMFNKYRN